MEECEPEMVIRKMPQRTRAARRSAAGRPHAQGAAGSPPARQSGYPAAGEVPGGITPATRARAGRNCPFMHAETDRIVQDKFRDEDPSC